MAKVKGVKEKLHLPIYDAFFVPQGTTFEQEMTRRDPRVIRFFVDVQSKTKLETNLQTAGQLPSLNTFEARAMRVVTSHVLNGATNPDIPDSTAVLAELIYNSVTSLLVGEKIMIEVPTFWFPSGSGVSPGTGTVPNFGEPDPLATFRFAEPVIIEPQQNFRVEILFPQGVPGTGNQVGTLGAVNGPFRLWVVLDGYLTRDVQ